MGHCRKAQLAGISKQSLCGAEHPPLSAKPYISLVDQILGSAGERPDEGKCVTQKWHISRLQPGCFVLPKSLISPSRALAQQVRCRTPIGPSRIAQRQTNSGRHATSPIEG